MSAGRAWRMNVESVDVGACVMMVNLRSSSIAVSLCLLSQLPTTNIPVEVIWKPWKSYFYMFPHNWPLIVIRSYAFSIRTLIILRKCSRDASPENTYWILRSVSTLLERIYCEQQDPIRHFVSYWFKRIWSLQKGF